MLGSFRGPASWVGGAGLMCTQSLGSACKELDPGMRRATLQHRVVHDKALLLHEGIVDAEAPRLVAERGGARPALVAAGAAAHNAAPPKTLADEGREVLAEIVSVPGVPGIRVADGWLLLARRNFGVAGERGSHLRTAAHHRRLRNARAHRAGDGVPVPVPVESRCFTLRLMAGVYSFELRRT